MKKNENKIGRAIFYTLIFCLLGVCLIAGIASCREYEECLDKYCKNNGSAMAGLNSGGGIDEVTCLYSTESWDRENGTQIEYHRYYLNKTEKASCEK